MRLKNKVILITGAGSGIGRATAILFSKEGAQLILNDISEEDLKTTFAALDGDEHQIHCGDISDSSVVQDLFESIASSYKRIDGVINNAGIGRFPGDGENGEIHETNDESWNNYLSTPNYRVGAWENNSTLRNPEAWFQENMERYSEYGEYTPQHNGTLFHVVLNHMVEELIRNDVKVVLVAAPRNPMIFEYLGPGQTDGLNSSLLDLKLSDDVFVENMFWEKWEAHDFLDRNHLNGDGRQKMCGKLAPMIDSILIGD